MKIYIKTYGCQMNEYDSRLIKSILNNSGHEIVSEENNADLLLFNTCSVRDKAEHKVISKINSIKNKKELKIGIIGCMAQRLGIKLKKIIPDLDCIIGVNQILKLPNLINKTNAISLSLNSEMQYNSSIAANKILYQKDNVTDYIAVMRGCNMFCTYCIVPYVRGKEHSRKIDNIIEEIKIKANFGIKEIILLGQNISAYGTDFYENSVNIEYKKQNSMLPELLLEVSKIKSIERIKFLSPHPYFFNDKLIKVISDTPKISKNIHIVLQSGSDKILKMMNRRYDTNMYIDIIQKLKNNIPDVKFSTDIIVGFPNESDEDFNKTRKIFNEVCFENAYIFMYSPRNKTLSAKKYNDNIPLHIKKERNNILLNDLKKNILKCNKKLINKTFDILIKKNLTYSDKYIVFGETINGKIVKIINETKIPLGTIKHIIIQDLEKNILTGKFINDK